MQPFSGIKVFRTPGGRQVDCRYEDGVIKEVRLALVANHSVIIEHGSLHFTIRPGTNRSNTRVTCQCRQECALAEGMHNQVDHKKALADFIPWCRQYLPYLFADESYPDDGRSIAISSDCLEALEAIDAFLRAHRVRL